MCEKCGYNLIGGHVSIECDKPYCLISDTWLTNLDKKDCKWFTEKTNS